MIEFEPRNYLSPWILTLAFCFVMGCSRKTPANDDGAIDSGIDAGINAPTASASEVVPPQPVEAPKSVDSEDASIPASESLRRVVAKIENDAALAPHTDALDAFFKEKIPLPLLLQVESLPRRRNALLVANQSDLDHPFVMAIDANGTRAWTKEMPLAGIVPGVRDLAIVRGLESSVGLAFCDSTGQRAALRMWNADGSINADYEVMEVPHCENISAIYIPSLGHVIGSTGETTARIGLIAVNGMRAWDSTGISVPWTAMPRTALTIAADSDNSLIVVGIDTAEKEKRRPNDGNIVAIRFDGRGRALWPEPIVLGPRHGRTLNRLRVRVMAPRKVEVQVADKPEKYVDLTSDGVMMPLE